MLVIAATVCLEGCASGPVFVSSSAPNAATLKGSQFRNQTFSETGLSGTVYTKEIWEQYKVWRIDGLPVPDETLKVDPGLRRLYVRAYFNQGDNPGLFYEAWVTLEVNLQPGMSYALNGRTTAFRFAEIWLDDSETGKRATEAASGPAKLLKPFPILLLPAPR